MGSTPASLLKRMPGQNRWRDTKTYLDNSVKFVDEKFDTLGVITVFGHALEEDRVVTGFAFTGPEGSNVERVLKEMPKEYLNKLVEASYLDQEERKGAHNTEKANKRRKKNKTDVVVKEDFAKPSKPVYAHSDVDMRIFFPRFIRSVLSRENVSMKGRNLWATKKTDEEGRELVTPPVEVPFWNRDIISPAHYHGHGKRYKFGNILERQIMQVANILTMNSVNPDTFCQEVPTDYVPKNYTLEQIIAIGSYTLDEISDIDSEASDAMTESALIFSKSGPD